MGRHDARQSANVGHRPRMRSATRVLLTILSTLLNTSVTPNSPMFMLKVSFPSPPRSQTELAIPSPATE